MKFEHDILISYAPSNGAENQATSAWTAKFCEYFTVLMHRLYDRKPVIMLNDNLRIQQSTAGENPEAELLNTAVFVVILSTEYLKSPEYVKELEALHDHVHNHQDAGIQHRLFKVLMHPVPPENQPACLKGEQNYDFFEINRYNKKPMTWDLFSKSGPDPKFWSKLVDLAYDISDVLGDLTVQKGISIPVAERPAVFLAETTFDQAENRDMLKRELRHQGFQVLPQAQIPEDAGDAKKFIEENLKQSIVAVHLLGAWYGEFIKNSKYSFIDFQIKTVKDYINAKGAPATPYQVIWIPNDIKPTDQRQALYLKRLKRDEAQQRTEIIETPFEVFKTILNARLKEFTDPVVIPEAEKNKLYVIYEKQSADHMAEYINLLKSKGFDVLEPNSGNGDFFPISTHVNNLLVADAVLIYKGDCTMEWLNSKIRDLVKAPGYGKSKPFRAVEIISKQKTADKSLLFLNNVPVNWDEALNSVVINHFIDHLAKK
jgi:hypothetical protein